jgi:hypothetical protein
MLPDAQGLRTTAPQSMKWLTEISDAEAMIVSRCKLRRRLFADAANWREAISRHAQFQAMHHC